MAWRTAFMDAYAQYSQLVAGCGMGCVYFAFLYPEVWGVRSYRNLTQFYKKGQPTLLDEECHKIGEEILDKMDMDVKSEANVRFYMAYGPDLLHKGSTYTNRGGVVGIPTTFTYQSTDDIEREQMTLNNMPIDWSLEAAQSLGSALILSQNAKRFGIAREVMYLNSYHAHCRPLIASMSIGLSYAACFFVSRMINMRKRFPLGSRLIFYGIFAAIGLVFAIQTHDSYSCHLDQKADRRAAALGLEYTLGGLEFYNKQLQMNVALRSLLYNGESLYTAYGNTAQNWRCPSMPLTQRRDYLQSALKLREKEAAEKKAGESAESCGCEQNVL